MKSLFNSFLPRFSRTITILNNKKPIFNNHFLFNVRKSLYHKTKSTWKLFFVPISGFSNSYGDENHHSNNEDINSDPKLVEIKNLLNNSNTKPDQNPQSSSCSQDDKRIAELTAQIEKLEIDNQEFKNKYMASLADLDNLRKRVDRELLNNSKYAISSFAKSLLEVADNFERAIIVSKDEKVDSSFKTLYEGLLLIEKNFQAIFNRFNITKINSLNEKFDPNIHDAVLEIDDVTKEPNTVAVVFKNGYLIGNRVLRAANVGIVKKR